MKYNVGDEFTFTTVFSQAFRNFTILNFRVDVQEYEVSYPDGRKVTLPESFIDEELRLGYITLTNIRTNLQIDSVNGYTRDNNLGWVTTLTENICSHPNKYLNKVFTMQFYVCPDCKKEV